MGLSRCSETPVSYHTAPFASSMVDIRRPTSIEIDGAFMDIDRDLARALFSLVLETPFESS